MQVGGYNTRPWLTYQRIQPCSAALKSPPMVCVSWVGGAHPMALPVPLHPQVPGAKSMGMGISLPFEKGLNKFVTDVSPCPAFFFSAWPCTSTNCT